MSDETYVYKLVRVRDGQYISAVIDRDELRLTYRIGEATRPKEPTRIFAFEEENQARRFGMSNSVVRLNGHAAILKCKAVMAEGRPVTAMADHSVAAIMRWWRVAKFSGSDFNVPDGTVWCEEVEPVEVVTEWKFEKGDW